MAISASSTPFSINTSSQPFTVSSPSLAASRTLNASGHGSASLTLSQLSSHQPSDAAADGSRPYQLATNASPRYNHQQQFSLHGQQQPAGVGVGHPGRAAVAPIKPTSYSSSYPSAAVGVPSGQVDGSGSGSIGWGGARSVSAHGGGVSASAMSSQQQQQQQRQVSYSAAQVVDHSMSTPGGGSSMPDPVPGMRRLLVVLRRSGGLDRSRLHMLQDTIASLDAVP